MYRRLLVHTRPTRLHAACLLRRAAMHACSCTVATRVCQQRCARSPKDACVLRVHRSPHVAACRISLRVSTWLRRSVAQPGDCAGQHNSTHTARVQVGHSGEAAEACSHAARVQRRLSRVAACARGLTTASTECATPARICSGDVGQCTARRSRRELLKHAHHTQTSQVYQQLASSHHCPYVPLPPTYLGC